MAWIERYWQRINPLAALLYPLSLVFRLGVLVRRALHRARIIGTHRLPVPVVVVGNISVGGTGKTPLVLWLVALLRRHGHRPGIVSRGYGGTGPMQAVTPDSDPAVVGDEPVMLARRGGMPLWAGRDRVAAAQALLSAHPDCDVIVCDDGLQHYRLARDVEIAVVDGERGLGNGWMFPAGPLREPRARLASVNAVVVNGAGPTAMMLDAPVVYTMTLAGETFQNLQEPGRCVGPDHFSGRQVHAVAGIGHPPRFFAQLQQLGLDIEAHAFPDHHPYSAADLAPWRDCEGVMTEKDAVKCRTLVSERWWVLGVDARLDPAFGELVMQGIARPS